MVTVCTQLTAPGVTAAILTGRATYHTFQYVVAAINTNVVVRAEGSLDGTSWFNLSASETDVTKTANGQYGMSYNGVVPQVRFRFVSESGGTAATIDVTYEGW